MDKRGVSLSYMVYSGYALIALSLIVIAFAVYVSYLDNINHESLVNLESSNRVIDHFDNGLFNLTEESKAALAKVKDINQQMKELRNKWDQYLASKGREKALVSEMGKLSEYSFELRRLNSLLEDELDSEVMVFLLDAARKSQTVPSKTPGIAERG
ncbi:hypothetical protein ACFLZZ_03640 [Nanoarchaeota archaeon]